MALDGRQLRLKLCMKCGFSENTFFEMSISEFCVESAGLLKMLSKPMQNDFCNYVESAELLRMLLDVENCHYDFA